MNLVTNKTIEVGSNHFINGKVWKVMSCTIVPSDSITQYIVRLEEVV